LIYAVRGNSNAASCANAVADSEAKPIAAMRTNLKYFI
jgi:hypothetical protein